MTMKNPSQSVSQFHRAPPRAHHTVSTVRSTPNKAYTAGPVSLADEEPTSIFVRTNFVRKVAHIYCLLY